MSHEQTNGTPPDPKAHLRLSAEEWKRYNAELEAKWTPHLNAEEMEQSLDLDWALSDPEVDRLYSDKVVAVYRRQVIASGTNTAEVLAEAQRLTGLPPHRITVVLIEGPDSIMAGH